jgi:phosphatidylserine/phosphatidylglycerophosphate/cardiolipin synthase-like enzyme
MVIDDNTVITGSFNFTNNAEQSNAENLLIIRDKDIAKTYADNWRAHAAHSREYQEKPWKDRDGQPERRQSKSRKSNSKNGEKEVEREMKKLLN